MLKLDFIGQLILYADDAALVYVLDLVDGIKHAMQHDADLLHAWLCRNVLSVNAAKTCYMPFGNAKNMQNLNITIDSTAIKRVN